MNSQQKVHKRAAKHTKNDAQVIHSVEDGDKKQHPPPPTTPFIRFSAAKAAFQLMQFPGT
jgi:hypothetical protein